MFLAWYECCLYFPSQECVDFTSHHLIGSQCHPSNHKVYIRMHIPIVNWVWGNPSILNCSLTLIPRCLNETMLSGNTLLSLNTWVQRQGYRHACKLYTWILYKRMTFNLQRQGFVQNIKACMQIVYLTFCTNASHLTSTFSYSFPLWTPVYSLVCCYSAFPLVHLNWWSRYVLYNLIANHVHVLYSKNSLVHAPLCVE